MFLRLKQGWLLTSIFASRHLLLFDFLTNLKWRLMMDRWHLAWGSEVVSHHGKVFFDDQIKEEYKFYDSLSTLYHTGASLIHSSLMHSPTHPPHRTVPSCWFRLLIQVLLICLCLILMFEKNAKHINKFSLLICLILKNSS